jgi:hypothetical protein
MLTKFNMKVNRIEGIIDFAGFDEINTALSPSLPFYSQPLQDGSLRAFLKSASASQSRSEVAYRDKNVSESKRIECC